MYRISIKITISDKKTTQYKKHVYTNVKFPNDISNPFRIRVIRIFEWKKMINKNNPSRYDSEARKCREKLFCRCFIQHYNQGFYIDF